MRRNNWVLAAGAMLATLVSVFAIRPAQADSRWGANYFPNVELIDQNGEKHNFYDDLLKGKIVVIELFYTHCLDICPLETARLAQVQKMLGDRVGKDIFFYSISLDPKRDTPETMKAYAEKYHAGPGWLFLTGKKEDVELVTRKMGLYRDPDPNDRDGHAPHLLLGNEATGQWLRNNALDNPRFLAVMIGDWMNSWRSARPMTSGKSYEEATGIRMDPGKYLFHTECAPCHTIGGGDLIGPDLRGVTTVRDLNWLRRMIRTPEVLLQEKDPQATALFEKYKRVRMPNLHLDGDATDLLISYLQKQSAQTAAAASAKPNTEEQAR